MLINRETDYALRILRSLSDGRKHPMKELCAQEDIPQQFAYKIIGKLSAAGLTDSTRGVGGGCSLTRDLREITLYDLIRILDTDHYINACLKPGYVCDWKEKNCSICSFHSHLLQIQGDLDRELKKHTVRDMLGGAKSVPK